MSKQNTILLQTILHWFFKRVEEIQSNLIMFSLWKLLDSFIILLMSVLDICTEKIKLIKI